MMDVIEFAKCITDENRTIDFLPERKILKSQRVCCKVQSSIVGDISKNDKYVFQCNICKKRYSICENSYFFKSKLTLQVLLTILYYFSIGSSVSQCCKMLKKKASKVSIIQWYTYYRDVMTM